MNHPLVSITIPAYNNGPFIGATLQSILSQTYTHLEIIVVDDCSTDTTVEVINSFKDPRITLVKNEQNLGMHGNWDKAVSLANGAYVKLVCGDDLLEPTCIEKQVAVLQAQPEVALVGCRRKIINAQGKTSMGALYKLLPGTYTGKAVMRACAFFGTNLVGEPMTVLFRGDNLRNHRIKMGANNYMIDLDMYSKHLEHGKFVMLPDYLAAFRIYGDSMTGVLGMRKRSAMFREFISEPRLKEKFGINWFFKTSAYISEFIISWMRTLVLKLSK